MVTKQFVLAGDAIFTVEPSDTFREAMAQLGREYHEHYTYRVESVTFPAKGVWPATTHYFVKSLAGPDNTSDYVYLGTLNPDTGEVRITKKSAFPETATRVQIIRKVLARLIKDEGKLIEDAGWKVHHEGRCGRCGRLLTVPESIESGIGPECGRKLALAS